MDTGEREQDSGRLYKYSSNVPGRTTDQGNVQRPV